MGINDPQELELDHEPKSDDPDVSVGSFQGDKTASKHTPTSEQEGPFILQSMNYSPDSVDETARKTGLAWSAGIVFFSAIAFMLFLGWIADLLLGSSPWGLVGGIVLGSVIGFIQFFRISSQIFDNSAPKSGPQSLFDESDDDH